MATDHCVCLACKRTCTHTYSVCHVYEQCTNVVHTVYVLTLCIQITGFRGSRRDQDKQAGGPVSTKPPDTDDEERDGSPCGQDKEFSRGDQTLTPWKRQLPIFWMDWRGKSAVASRTCTDFLVVFRVQPLRR